MSNPRYKWWGYVKWCIRDYPAKCAELYDLLSQSCTPSYSGMPGAGEASRTTENIALRGFSGQREREYNGVVAAIADTQALDRGEERMKFIDMIFFSKTHTLTGAGLACYISERTAQEWHREFIRLVAKHMGLLDN